MSNTHPTHESARAGMTAPVHVNQHVDPHNKVDAMIFGMKITIGCCLPLGVLIGIDRAPGSFYAYGLSCFMWPIITSIVLGAAIGASLGFVFDAVGHASDPVVAPEAQKTPGKKPSRLSHTGLTPHMRGH